MKLKSLEPFKSYLLNSTANPAHFHQNWLPGFWFFFNILISIYFFRYETIETNARAFLTLYILSIGTVTVQDHHAREKMHIGENIPTIPLETLTTKVTFLFRPDPCKAQCLKWQHFYHKCHCFVGYCHMFTIKHYNTLIYFPNQNFNFSNPSLCNFDLTWQILIWSYLKSLFPCLIFSNFAVQNYDLRFYPWFCQR